MIQATLPTSCQRTSHIPYVMPANDNLLAKDRLSARSRALLRRVMTSVADLGNNERRYSVSLSSCLARAHYQTRQGWLFAARAPQRCGRHHDRDRSIKGRSQRRKRRPPSEGRLTPAYTLGSHANPIERRPAGQSSCMCLRSCCRSMCRRSPRPDHRRGRQKRNPAQREAGRDEKNCAPKPRPARQRPPD